MELVFATNNKHKLQEIKAQLGDSFLLKTLADIGNTEDIAETADTIEGNASLKSYYILKNYRLNCFADDSGLEIEALHGKPGVTSARYAGEQRNDEDNINKVLLEMSEQNNRNAQFKTIISLVIDGKEYLFEGIIKGIITNEKLGKNGFGYDPIFIPNGYKETFAQMDFELKNKISHRAIAFAKLITFLKTV